jgi:hypothetical protein
MILFIVFIKNKSKNILLLFLLKKLKVIYINIVILNLHIIRYVNNGLNKKIQLLIYSS